MELTGQECNKYYEKGHPLYLQSYPCVSKMVKFPPKFSLIAYKPLIYDVAFYHLAFYQLKLESAGAGSKGWVTAFMAGLREKMEGIISCGLRIVDLINIVFNIWNFVLYIEGEKTIRYITC